MVKQVKLGKNQQFLLGTMARDGRGSFPGGGWKWQNYSTTAKMLDGLVKKGLVSVKVTEPKVVQGFYQHGTRYWTITPLGEVVGKGYASLVEIK